MCPLSLHTPYLNRLMITSTNWCDNRIIEAMGNYSQCVSV